MQKRKKERKSDYSFSGNECNPFSALADNKLFFPLIGPNETRRSLLHRLHCSGCGHPHKYTHTHTHTYISRPLDKAEKLFVRKLISSLSPEYIYIYIVQGGRGDDPARPAVVIPPHFPPPRVCACVLRARPRMDFRCVVCCWLARHSLLLANVRCSFLELRRAALP